ncbi:MAG: histidine--tRNA ligase [Nanoarchaeota archaeon]|nr:histidine--tRNA ligase [Nanoarchaeota archaeon]MBU4124234.1 histidine--tRNA ligase [Nanoarchaeota archaeon]
MFQVPKGTRDLAPKEARKYYFVIDVLRGVFEKYGFGPLITPAFEDYGLLSAKSGPAIKNEIYYFKDKSNRELGLRFEFTASLARFMSNNPNLVKPFKRYQVGTVWRYDNPQAMRFREFTQADVDIIGSTSVLADFEVLSCFCSCMDALGFKDYYIRINSRKLLEEKLTILGKVTNVNDVFRIIDKTDKIGESAVKEELKRRGFDPVKIMKIVKSLKPEGEIKELLKYAKDNGIEKKLKFDASLVRGLEYYTGLVFEVYAGKGLSCGGGGRYDNLIKQLGGPELSATGISFGVDRLIGLMNELKLFKPLEEGVFIITANEKLMDNTIELCKDLRAQGIKCDYDLMNRKFSKQLEYASSIEVPYVIIVGEKELKQGKILLKDMKTGKEELINSEDVCKLITSS